MDPIGVGARDLRECLLAQLHNLKRVYVGMHSFPQARTTTDALLALQPSSLADLRDRGLLAYHLDDYAGALRDLEDYLRLNTWSARSEREEHDQIWEHVKSLRRRVAGLN